MSNGLRFALDQLNPAMRAQAEAQLAGRGRLVNGRAQSACDGPGGSPTHKTVEPEGRQNETEKKGKLPKQRSNAEGLLETALLGANVAGVVAEYRFDQKRRWRADFAIPVARLLIEVEGGIWSGGRHVRGEGYLRDCEKYNAATLSGWRVFRFATSQIVSGYALRTILEALK